MDIVFFYMQIRSETVENGGQKEMAVQCNQKANMWSPCYIEFSCDGTESSGHTWLGRKIIKYET